MEPTTSPTDLLTLPPTSEVMACTDDSISQYYMCDIDHIAICYQHNDDHVHNKCVPMYHEDIVDKRPGIDYY